MIEFIGECAMLEQLAEESAELTKAALKLERIRRGENPTPVTEAEARANLTEEYTDVCTCARELRLEVDEDMIQRKQKRFLDRWNAKEDQTWKSADLCR